MDERIHIVSAATFLLICLLFLLPFMSLECGNNKMVTVTGIQLVTGISYEAPLDQRDHTTSKASNSDFFADIALMSALCGIVFSIYHKLDNKYLKSSVITCSSLIAVALLGLQIEMNSKLDEHANAALVRINYEIGYWLCLIIPIVLNAIILLVLKNPVTTRDSY